MRRGKWHFLWVLVSLGLALPVLWARFHRTAQARAGAQAELSSVPLAPSAQAPELRAPGRRLADETRARLVVLRAQAASTSPGAGAAASATSASPASTGSGSDKKGQTHVATRGAAGMPAAVGSGNQAHEAQGRYVQRLVHEQFLRLAGGCYDELLARRPGTRGLLNLSVLVGGHPSVGGVVESVEILPDSTLREESFDTCMVESMMAVQFDAPPGAQGRITFHYPFELAPDPPDAGMHP